MPMQPGIPMVWPTEINLSDASGAPRKWIQVAKTGNFFSQRYGKFSITVDDLKSMLRNFKTITPIAPTQLPVDYDHLSMDPKKPGDGKAAGWFTGPMELRGETLWAEVEFTPPAAESIKAKEYRFVSPSFVRDYVWKEGKNIGTTLIAAAITNHPFLEGMEAITLSNGLGELAVQLSDGALPMEVGQKVAVSKESSRAPRDESLAGKSFEVVEIAGAGNDAFAMLKGDDGSEIGWYRISELEPARLAPVPKESTTPPEGLEAVDPAVAAAAAAPKVATPKAAQLSEDKMADVFNLRNSQGQTVEVKAEDLQSFLDEQLKVAAPKAGEVVSLSQFEESNQQVISLKAEVEALRAKNVESEKAQHAAMLAEKLNAMASEGKVTRPQREWALKTFADPIALSAFEEWAATCTKQVVNLNTQEHGSSVGANEDGPAVRPDSQLLVLAQARMKEKNIDLRTALSQVSSERTDLSKDYRDSFRPADKRERAIH